MTTSKTGEQIVKEEIIRVEINFPVKVAFSDVYLKAIVEIVAEVCKGYERNHPGRVMWAAGIGSKITSMPMTQQDDIDGVPIEFADDTLAIDCYERSDYQAKCAKCGMEQGDHKDHMLNSPAGDCEFELSKG